MDCLFQIIRSLRLGSCLSASEWSLASSENSPSTPPSGASTPRRRKGSRKKTGSHDSGFDAWQEEQHHLSKVPDRMFQNGSNSVASLFTMQGKKGVNQDAMIVWENFASTPDTVFCGVFDGHGPNGHLVARSVRDVLPLKLSANWDVNTGTEDHRDSTDSRLGNTNTDEVSSDPNSTETNDFEDEDKHPEIYKLLRKTFLKAFKVVDKELKAHPKVDCFCSGTTAVTLIKQGQHIIVGNLGDSRAVLGTREENDSLTAVQLTVDLKPSVPREAERIRQRSGRVFSLRDEPGVARVWLPNSDSPGLAMARAFGDFCLKDFGLISVPEVTHRQITEKDEFVVLATDGVWDVLSNKEVVDIIASAPARSIAARVLVQHAVRSWRLKYPTSKTDDCAVVCLFLNVDTTNSYSNPKPNEIELSKTTGEKDSSSPAYLDSLTTVHSGAEILQVEGSGNPNKLNRSQSRKRPSSSNATQPHGGTWSALDGVSRVNTLLALPKLSALQEPANTKTRKSD